MGSRLVRENPDFILRNGWGIPVSAGATMETLFNTALDLTHAGALEYACSIVRTAVHDWGFPYLKLDFLYAAALPGRHKDPTLTRAQVMRTGLEALRQAAGPEAYLLGCGVPLGSALGLVQACRIGDDVSPEWKPKLPGLPISLEKEVHFPSTRNALQNVLTRAPLHGRWWVNDPDCLLIRPDSDLSLSEVQTLASAIALTGGALLLSDEMQALPPERQRLVQALLPLIGQRPRILDWFDAPRPTRLRLDLDGPAGPWHLLGWFNWSDQPQEMVLRPSDFVLPPGDYWARSFWDGTSYLLQAGKTAPPENASSASEPSDRVQPGSEAPVGIRFKLAKHGVKVLAVRPALVSEPQYLGGDLHISQGKEISSWQVRGNFLRLGLALPRKTRGTIELALPLSPLLAWQDGKPITWEPGDEGRYCFPVDFDSSAIVEVKF
jgi:alpha-galactosidase